MWKPNELRKKTAEELEALRVELGDELFKMNMQNKMGQLEKSHRLSELRKDIARVHTTLQQFSLASKEKEMKKDD